MKKSIILLLALFFVACSDDENTTRRESEGDGTEQLVPFSFAIQVVDSLGRSLLEGDAKGLDISGISMRYDGNTYAVKDLGKTQTVEGENRFYGIGLYYDRTSQSHLLMVGEWDGETMYTNETFTILWPDATQDVFRFDYTYQYIKEEKRIEFNNAYFLNDQKNNGTTFRIVK